MWVSPFHEGTLAETKEENHLVERLRAAAPPHQEEAVEVFQASASGMFNQEETLRKTQSGVSGLVLEHLGLLSEKVAEERKVWAFLLKLLHQWSDWNKRITMYWFYTLSVWIHVNFVIKMSSKQTILISKIRNIFVLFTELPIRLKLNIWPTFVWSSTKSADVTARAVCLCAIFLLLYEKDILHRNRQFPTELNISATMTKQQNIIPK